MNVKAERMEQMIQVVNRNLQLVFSGEQEGNTMRLKNLRTVNSLSVFIFVFTLQALLHWRSVNWKRLMQ